MAWTNNNKNNARFNPNRKDDRLLKAEVTSRREHKIRREVEPEVELVSTEPSHVLSMPAETRLDWLQMALMQAGMGKLKPTSLFEVIKEPAFGPNSSAARKPLKAMVLANLHLFSAKQKNSLKEAVSNWSSSGGGRDDAGGGDNDRGAGGRGDKPAGSERDARTGSGDRDGSRERRKKKHRRSRSRSCSAPRSPPPARSRSERSPRSRSRGRRHSRKE
mmetsp:Transcript_39631/g.84512  ORF Transcript_39631/g.84512 Transcript_39631/m.84512 type:complete len:218 (+) Transcript_39631:122-775(+)